MYISIGNNTLERYQQALASSSCLTPVAQFEEWDYAANKAFVQNLVLIEPACLTNAAFKRFVEKEKKSTSASEFFNADIQNLDAVLNHPDSALLTIPVKTEDIGWFRACFPGQLDANAQIAKYPAQDYYRVFIDPRRITKGLLFLQALQKKLGNTEPSDQLIGTTLGPDMLNLYLTVKKLVQNPAQAQPTNMTNKTVLAPADKNGLEAIPSSWFDFYARATQLPAVLGKGGYRALLHVANTQLVYHEELAGLARVDGHKAPWLVDLMHGLNDQNRLLIGQTLSHFQYATDYREFSFADHKGLSWQVASFVDTTSGLIHVALTQPDTQKRLTMESLNTGSPQPLAQVCQACGITDPSDQIRCAWALAILMREYALLRQSKPALAATLEKEFAKEGGT